MSSEISIKCPNCKSNVPVGYPICPYCGYDLRLIIRFRAIKELTFKDILNRIKKALIKPFEVYPEIVIAPDNRGGTLLLVILSVLLTLRLSLVLNHFLSELLPKISLLSKVLEFSLALLLSFLLCFIGSIIYILLINFSLDLMGAETQFSLSFAIFSYSLWPTIWGVFISNIAMMSILPEITENLSITFQELSSLLIFPRTLFLSGLFLTGILTGYGLSKAYMMSKFITIPLSILFLYILVVL